VIRLFEKSLNRPLQWFICLLHANELPLRHLIISLDGPTSGPKAFSGKIGSCLKNVEKMPVVSFQKIEFDCPVVEVTDLSSDQAYLLRICSSIMTGNFPKVLEKKSPGALNHARWLTTANRILRLYVSTVNPSEVLLILVEFIMKVYAPMWFSIKSEPSCLMGAKHVFKTIKLTRYLPENLKQVIEPVINRNGFFAHPENVILSMLGDSRRNIRKQAVDHILRVRKKRKPEKEVRKFTVPKINFDAKSYQSIVQWKTSEEPPVTMYLSNEELKQIVIDPGEILSDIKGMPCHTQSVERGIKLVTEAAKLVCGSENRDAMIKVKQTSRAKMPKFDSKKEYVL
jgi:hypothetical protein